MTDLSASRDDALCRIAAILKVPVERFRGGDLAEKLDGAARCLALWQQIESAHGRQKALDALDRIAREERDADRAA